MNCFLFVNSLNLIVWEAITQYDSCFSLYSHNRSNIIFHCLNLSITEAYIFRLLLNMLKLVNVSKVITYFSMNIFKMESDVLLLTCNKDENSNILTGGRNLQRLWLSLAKEEIYTHPLSQIIDGTKTSNMLKDLMKLDDNEKAFAIFRVGKSKKPAYSPRL